MRGENFGVLPDNAGAPISAEGNYTMAYDESSGSYIHPSQMTTDRFETPAEPCPRSFLAQTWACTVFKP